MLTQAELQSKLHYDPETGIFTWIKSTGSVKANKIAGYLTTQNYLRIKIFDKNYLAHRLAWLYVYGYFPKEFIDHINGIRNDNSINNLREASMTQNNQNRHVASKNNKTKLIGATLHKHSKKYCASIKANYIKYYLGYFDTAEEAHQAYLNAKKIYHK